MNRIANDFTWKIGGQAGFGVMATGASLAKICVRAGLYIWDYSEYPSLIHGGHNTYQLYAAAREMAAPRYSIDLLVALNKETIDRHLGEMSPHGLIMYDQSDQTLQDWVPPKDQRQTVWLGLPLDTLARQAGGSKLMRNTVALGATIALLSLDFEFPSKVVSETFRHKGPEVVTLNAAVLQAGYQAIRPIQATTFPWDIVPQPRPRPLALVSGNEAIGLGALQAGCSFYAAYPMTPSSTLLHFMAEHGPGYGTVVRHAEDEIGVVNETIGAAYAGVRAMCATAGGGFALMTEAIGLAGMTEVGIVVVEAQRGGPSTGLPTWTEQADLRQVLHAGQGDFLKIVLAPADQVDCWRLTQLAFSLADEWQTPVIIMTDKYLAEGHAAVDLLSETTLPVQRGHIIRPAEPPPGGMYPRYRTDTKNGVSPRPLPGTPHGMFLANSDEHDQFGISNEDIDVRQAQMAKRARKADAVARILPTPTLVGPAKADVTVVSWGSSIGPVKEAMALLNQAHRLRINLLPLTVINPLPVEHIQKLLQDAVMTIMVEGNQSGQMAGWIREQTGVMMDHHIRRFDGRPFDPRHLAEQIRALTQ
ncbi:MAG: 2-oxoacid:acceptor oxidoreductase subunit alpha [Candidatus Kerfeldbacteria bacterium]|nr:2-oxoacid:acceptor oxidoreductase subunit alpha [Candidatus Kerfeldbacteria bacterium]